MKRILVVLGLMLLLSGANPVRPAGARKHQGDLIILVDTGRLEIVSRRLENAAGKLKNIAP